MVLPVGAPQEECPVRPLERPPTVVERTRSPGWFPVGLESGESVGGPFGDDAESPILPAVLRRPVPSLGVRLDPLQCFYESGHRRQTSLGDKVKCHLGATFPSLPLLPRIVSFFLGLLQLGEQREATTREPDLVITEVFGLDILVHGDQPGSVPPDLFAVDGHAAPAFNTAWSLRYLTAQAIPYASVRL